MAIVSADFLVKSISNFHDSGYLGEKTIAQARRKAPDSISRVMTYLQGKASNKFPLTMLSEGQFTNGSAMQSVGVDTVEFTWPVIGDIDKADEITATNYSSTDKPGLGGTEITVTFKTNWLKNQHIITSEKGTQARVNAVPTRGAGGFIYKLICWTNNPLDYIDYSEFSVGKKWIMTSPGIVSAELSFGNESNLATGGLMKGQLSAMRKSFHYAGAVVKQVVECNITDDKGGKSTYWMSMAEWQHEIQWRELTEHQAWKGIYTRGADGRIFAKDPDTGLELLSGAGIEQQIPHHDTYTTLTLNKIKSTFNSVMYQGGAQPDSGKLHILYCGMGFEEDFSDAILNHNQGAFAMTGEQFTKEYNGGLIFGNYYKAFKTIQGDIIKLEKLPLLDFGPEAKIAPKHPRTGYPLTSHSAYLLDVSNYEGEPNVKMAYQNGRLMIKGREQGMTVINDGDYSKTELNLATSQDKTSIHYMSVKNPVIRNAQKCFYLSCDQSIGV